MHAKRIDNESAFKLYQMLKIEDVPMDNRYKYRYKYRYKCHVFPWFISRGYINEQWRDKIAGLFICQNAIDVETQ